ncbi:hypothetical protein ACWCQZ_28440 [Streptomyces sp. NPDC002285]
MELGKALVEVPDEALVGVVDGFQGADEPLALGLGDGSAPAHHSGLPAALRVGIRLVQGLGEQLPPVCAEHAIGRF